jgi:hypothetical protein
MKTTFPTWLAAADADPQALIKEARTGGGATQSRPG